MTNAVTGAAAHLGIEFAEYDTRIRTFIPGYSTMLRLAAFALQLAVRRPKAVVIDLGIGTGALSAACLERTPGARIVGVDADSAMLQAARARLGPALTRTIEGNFESIPIPRCDAVVAMLALHHVPTPARRLRLFRRIRQALHRGGVLISADCYPESNPRLAAFDRHMWIDHLEQSYTPAIARQYLKAWAREDHYVPLIEEIDLLRRAGFTVDVPGRKETWAVVVATTNQD